MKSNIELVCESLKGEELKSKSLSAESAGETSAQWIGLQCLSVIAALVYVLLKALYSLASYRQSSWTHTSYKTVETGEVIQFERSHYVEFLAARKLVKIFKFSISSEDSAKAVI